MCNVSVSVTQPGVSILCVSGRAASVLQMTSPLSHATFLKVHFLDGRRDGRRDGKD